MEPFTSEDREMWAFFRPLAGRALRMLGYGLCALFLLVANTYPLGGFWSLAIAVGLLGAASASAKIGQIAIAVLLAMALIPYPFVQSLVP